MRSLVTIPNEIIIESTCGKGKAMKEFSRVARLYQSHYGKQVSFVQVLLKNTNYCQKTGRKRTGQDILAKKTRLVVLRFPPARYNEDDVVVKHLLCPFKSMTK